MVQHVRYFANMGLGNGKLWEVQVQMAHPMQFKSLVSDGVQMTPLIGH